VIIPLNMTQTSGTPASVATYRSFLVYRYNSEALNGEKNARAAGANHAGDPLSATSQSRPTITAAVRRIFATSFAAKLRAMVGR
jgi:hypothetical protein